MEKVYIKYHPNNNLLTHEDILANKRYKDVKAPTRSVYVIDEENRNIIHS